MDEQFRNIWEPCVIFGITSIPSRAWHFSIMCESGAQWARVPLHMLRHELPSNDIKTARFPLVAALRPESHELHELQMWDCHGWEFGVCQYEYLREMNCQYRQRNGSLVPARYWFTVDHTDNGWSQFPPEHKCYHFLLLEDGTGQIAAQPNNRIVWRDDSFTKSGHPMDYRVVDRKIWHSEGQHINAQETAITSDD